MDQKALLLLLLCGFTKLSAQKTVTLSGYIMDASSREKLIGANVLSQDFKKGTHSNVYGFYSLTVPKGEKIVFTFSFVGYSPKEFEFPADSSHTLDLLLQPRQVLEEVVISGKKDIPVHEELQMSRVSIPISQIKALPALLGEVDVLKSLQLLPGVQGGTEGSAGLYVRGGGPDQNLYLLDGVPVYNVNHLGGFFSTFNADAISNVDLYKGGFPARFGGRLSSVVDIRMKEGNREKFTGEGSIGLISSKLLLEGPLKKGRGSYIVSGRRTYLDVLMAPLVKSASNGDEKGGYYFYDLNTKINYKLSSKDHIYLSGYFGKDRLHASSRYDNRESLSTNQLYWGNLTGVFRWNRIFHPKLFGNLSASYSSYDFNTEMEEEKKREGYTNTASLRLFSGIKDLTLKYDLDYLPNTRHLIRVGVSTTHQAFTPTTNSYHEKTGTEQEERAVKLGESRIEGLSADIYAEDEITVTDRLKANVGLRFSTFSVQNSFYAGLQPRLSARYKLGDNYSLKASYARMQQFINLLSFEGVGLPTDLWVPVTDRIKPQKSDQLAIGLSSTLSRQYELTFESYYKNMKNVIDYKDGSSYLSDGSYEDNVEMGIGRAFGNEFLVQKKEGRLQGMASYTLSWSQRKYPSINRGEWYYTRFDRRNDLKIAAIYKLSKRVELSGVWFYNTGAWATLPTTQYPAIPPDNTSGYGGLPNYYRFSRNFNNYIEHRNNYKMMDYHRLDLGVKFTKSRKRHERSWSFGVYNVYGRKNPFFLSMDESINMGGQVAVSQFSLFGFPLPYFNYSFKF